MTVSKAFRDAAAQRILIKDGPYGTAIQGLGLTEADYKGTLDLPMDQRAITTCST